MAERAIALAWAAGVMDATELKKLALRDLQAAWPHVEGSLAESAVNRVLFATPLLEQH